MVPVCLYCTDVSSWDPPTDSHSAFLFLGDKLHTMYFFKKGRAVVKQKPGALCAFSRATCSPNPCQCIVYTAYRLFGGVHVTVSFAKCATPRRTSDKGSVVNLAIISK